MLAAQESDGSWRHGDLAWQGDGAQRMTQLALMRLAYMGFGAEHPAIAKGTAFLFSLQREDGSWDIPSGRQDSETHEGYSMVPLQTALPLRALASCGYAADPRCERAYEWLTAQQLPDGGWPTGIAGGGTYGRVAGYRKLPHSRWGCRSNTTGVLLCFAHHPVRRSGAQAQRALDLLLGRETREAYTLGHEISRLIGAQQTRGFLTFYARFDLAMILDLCWRIGASLDDGRVADMAAYVSGLRGAYGLWEAAAPQASRWLSFDLLRSLKHINESTDWISTEPRTPFQTYPKKPRRY